MADIRNTAIVEFKVEGQTEVTAATDAVNTSFKETEAAAEDASRALQDYEDKINKAAKRSADLAKARFDANKGLRDEKAALRAAERAIRQKERADIKAAKSSALLAKKTEDAAFAFKRAQAEARDASLRAFGPLTKNVQATAVAIGRTSTVARPATRRLADLKDGVIQLANASVSSKSGFTDSLQAVENFGLALPGIGLAIDAVAVAVRLGAEAFFDWREKVEGATEANNLVLTSINALKKGFEDGSKAAREFKAQIAGDVGVFTQLSAAEGLEFGDTLKDISQRTKEIVNATNRIALLEGTATAAADAFILRQDKRGQALISREQRELLIAGQRAKLADQFATAVENRAFAIAELKAAEEKADAFRKAAAERSGQEAKKTTAAIKKQISLLDEFSRLDLRPLSDVLGIKETASDIELMLTEVERMTAALLALGDTVIQPFRSAGRVVKNFAEDLSSAERESEELSLSQKAGIQATDALATGFSQAAVAALFYGDSIKEGIRGAMQAIAIESFARSLFHGAAALGNLAFGNVPGATLHAEAAAGYAAAFAATSAVTLGTGGFQNPSAGGGGGGGAAAASGGAPSQSDFGGGGRGPTEMVTNVNSFSGTFFATKEAALRGLGAAAIEGINTQGRGRAGIKQKAIDTRAPQRARQRNRR